MFSIQLNFGREPSPEKPTLFEQALPLITTVATPVLSYFLEMAYDARIKKSFRRTLSHMDNRLDSLEAMAEQFEATLRSASPADAPPADESDGVPRATTKLSLAPKDDEA